MQQYFAFNVWDVNTAAAVLDAAADRQQPVILQTSARVFAKLPQKLFASYVRGYAAQKGVTVYLHLDHCRDMALLRQAVDVGWDSVMADGSQLPLAENVALVQEITPYAHVRGVQVEAEVGQIRHTGDFADNSQIAVASMQDIEQFLAAVQVDLFAAAIGTAHGLYHGTPVIHYDMIAAIGQLTDIPFVIHGGTGLDDETFRALLRQPNVKKINISTDVKQAYRQGICNSIEQGILNLQSGQGFEATRVEQAIYQAVYDMTEHKLSLLGERGA